MHAHSCRFRRAAAGLLSVFFVGAGSAQIPAFPGAEGFGAYAKGGRGGDVYHVVNLNTSGAGSLAEGLATVPAQGRTIVFDVSGYIKINGTLTLGSSKVTIAGQTAPGDGIGVTNGTFLIRGDDVIVRHFRFRDGYSADALNMDSNSTNTIIDHCDVMLSNDENFSSYNSPPENVTFQWSINAWGMETHSAGGLWDIRNGTTHHTLWSHNHTRNPKARPGLLDWVNNVTFDWDIGFIMGDSQTPADWRANVRGSYFICPPGNLRSVALEKASLDRNGVPNFSLYLDDCAMDANGDGVLNVSKSGYALASGSYRTSAEPFTTSGVPVTRDNYLTAYKKVVSAAGPLRLQANSGRPLRDEINSILVSNLVNRLRHHVSSPSGTGARNGGFGVLASAPAPADTDRDGMPNYWESATGSNPNVDDHNNPVPAGAYVPASPAGYTLLEEYLHFKAIPHAVVARNTSEQASYVDFDLARYTLGFNKAPVQFSCANAVGGTAVLQADGHTVRFTPELNFAGRARFDFTVKDGDSSTWTQTAAVIVTTTALPRDLLWKGDDSGNAWNTVTPNWVNGLQAAVFRPGDNVRFDDSGSAAPAVSMSGFLEPGLVEVDSTKDYTLGGPGVLIGTMELRKSGGGTLTVTSANTYSGATVVEESELIVTSGGDIGNGVLTLENAAITSRYGPTTAWNMDNVVAVPRGSTATINLSPRMTLNGFSGSGTLNLNVPGTLFVYNNLNGGYGGFSGELNITGMNPGALLTANFNGGGFDGNLANAVVSLDKVALIGRQNSTGNTLKFGVLNGTKTVLMAGSGYAGNQTIQVGARNLDGSFAGTISNGVSTTFLHKLGTGEWIFSGAGLHSGATTVSAGTLRVTGVLEKSTPTVLSGATLSGTGLLKAGATVQSGGRLSPGGEPGAPADWPIGGTLTLQGAELDFDLRGTPAGASDHIRLQGGLLTMSGTQRFQFRLVDGTLAPGVYTLISGGTNTSASGAGLAHNLPSDGRQTFSLQRPASGNGECYVRLVVSGQPATLSWLGNASTVWNTITTNWLNEGVPDTFRGFDAVIMDDRAASGAVIVTGLPQARSLLVSNTSVAYSFSGGPLPGDYALEKRGNGTLSLNYSNAFTGGLRVHEGKVALNAPGAAGAGDLLLSGSLQLNISDIYNRIVVAGDAVIIGSSSVHNTLKAPVSGSGNLSLQIASGRLFTQESDLSQFRGRIQLTGAGAFRLNQGGFNWGSRDVAFDLGPNGTLQNRATTAGASVTLGALSGGAGAVLRGSDQSAGAGETDVYIIGHLNTDTSFAGRVIDGAVHSVSLKKAGTGTVALSGTNSYSGGTVIENGTLVVGTVGASGTGAGDVIVGSGAVLAGSGVIGGSVSVEPGGRLEGSLQIEGSLSTDRSRVRFVQGAAPLRVSEDLTLDGVIELQSFQTPGEYLLIRYGGSLELGNVELSADFTSNCRIETIRYPGEVRLVVTQPAFSSASISGGMLRLTGTGGQPNSVFYIRSSTNLLDPDWQRISTNTVDGGGNFSISLPMVPLLESRWFRAEFP